MDYTDDEKEYANEFSISMYDVGIEWILKQSEIPENFVYMQSYIGKKE